jgi:hypothetical protein
MAVAKKKVVSAKKPAKKVTTKKKPAKKVVAAKKKPKGGRGKGAARSGG